MASTKLGLRRRGTLVASKQASSFHVGLGTVGNGLRRPRKLGLRRRGTLVTSKLASSFHVGLGTVGDGLRRPRKLGLRRSRNLYRSITFDSGVVLRRFFF